MAGMRRAESRARSREEAKVEELLVAALVGILVSWFILDQTEAKKASEQTVIEKAAPVRHLPARRSSHKVQRDKMQA